MNGDRVWRLCWLLVLLVLAADVVVAHETRPLLWVDQGHGQAFVVERAGELDLSRFAALLTDRGWQVAAADQPLSAELLQNVDGLILSGAFAPYRPEEIAAVLGYLQAGKRVAIMLHIGPPYAGLLNQLGVVFSNGVIREAGSHVIGDDPLNFSVTRLARHPLTEGVETINLFGAWALRNDGPQVAVLASTSSQSWVDVNGDRRLDADDARQSFGVVVSGRVGRGEFVVFGDDALFQNRFIHLNRRLAENLADWLRGEPWGGAGRGSVVNLFLLGMQSSTK